MTAVLTRPLSADTVLTGAATLIARHGFHPFGFGGRSRPDSITVLGYSLEGAIYETVGLLVDNWTLVEHDDDDPRWQAAKAAFRALGHHLGIAAPARAYAAVCDWSEGNPPTLYGKLLAVKLLGETAVMLATAKVGPQ